MIVINAGAVKYQRYSGGAKDGHDYNLNVYIGLKIKRCFLKKISEAVVEMLPDGDNRIYKTDSWTSIIPIKAKDYPEIMGTKGVIILSKYISGLGNCNYEFELIKALSKSGLIVWRNKVRGFDLSVSKDFKNCLDIEISSIFPTSRWTNVNYIITHIWRVLRRMHSGRKVLLVLNSMCRETEDVRIANKLGVKIIFSEFSNRRRFKYRKILNLETLVADIAKELS